MLFGITSSLRSLIEKAPILGKELTPLSGSALVGFRLHPGPVEKFILFLVAVFYSEVIFYVNTVLNS